MIFHGPWLQIDNLVKIMFQKFWNVPPKSVPLFINIDSLKINKYSKKTFRRTFRLSKNDIAWYQVSLPLFFPYIPGDHQKYTRKRNNRIIAYLRDDSAKIILLDNAWILGDNFQSR